MNPALIGKKAYSIIFDMLPKQNYNLIKELNKLGEDYV